MVKENIGNKQGRMVKLNKVNKVVNTLLASTMILGVMPISQVQAMSGEGVEDLGIEEVFSLKESESFEVNIDIRSKSFKELRQRIQEMTSTQAINEYDEIKRLVKGLEDEKESNYLAMKLHERYQSFGGDNSTYFTDVESQKVRMRDGAYTNKTYLDETHDYRRSRYLYRVHDENGRVGGEWVFRGRASSWRWSNARQGDTEYMFVSGSGWIEVNDWGQVTSRYPNSVSELVVIDKSGRSVRKIDIFSPITSNSSQRTEMRSRLIRSQFQEGKTILEATDGNSYVVNKNSNFNLTKINSERDLKGYRYVTHMTEEGSYALGVKGIKRIVVDMDTATVDEELSDYLTVIQIIGGIQDRYELRLSLGIDLLETYIEDLKFAEDIVEKEGYKDVADMISQIEKLKAKTYQEIAEFYRTTPIILKDNKEELENLKVILEEVEKLTLPDKEDLKLLVKESIKEVEERIQEHTPEGKGTAESPYIVRNQKQLMYIESEPDKNYVIEGNIVIGKEYLGDYDSKTFDFTGVIDGKGKGTLTIEDGYSLEDNLINVNKGVLKGLRIKLTNNVNSKGLVVRNEGTISDVIIESSGGMYSLFKLAENNEASGIIEGSAVIGDNTLTSNEDTGVLVKNNLGKISKSMVDVNIEGAGNISGIAHENTGSIDDVTISIRNSDTGKQIDSAFVHTGSGTINRASFVKGKSDTLVGDANSKAGVYDTYVQGGEFNSLTGNSDSPNVTFGYSYFVITPQSKANSVREVAGNSESVTDNTYFNINGGEGRRSLSQLKDKETYSFWDFDTVWDIDPNVNNGFPFLREGPVREDFEEVKGLEIKVVGNLTDWTNEDLELGVTLENNEGSEIITLPDNSTVVGIEANYTVSENGDYEFKANDSKGEEVVKTVTVGNIDKEVPTSPKLTVTEENKINVELGKDTLSGIDKHEYRLNEGAWLGTFDTSDLGDGNHTLQSRAYDKAGNVSEVSSVNFVVRDGIVEEVDSVIEEIDLIIKDLEDKINDALETFTPEKVDDIQGILDDLKGKVSGIEDEDLRKEYEDKIVAIEKALENLVTDEVLKGIHIDSGNIKMDEGDRKKLGHSSKLDATWTSSNEEVVEISQNGQIRAIAKGEATITVTIDGTEVSDSIKVTVEEVIVVVNVESFEIVDTNLEMKEGDVHDLDYSILPENATEKGITWTTGDSSVADVSNGKITALKEGSVLVKGVTKDGSIEDSILVTVKANKQDVGLKVTPRTEGWSNHVVVDIETTGDVGEVVLPNGAKVYNNKFSYVVLNNGSHIFSVVSEDGTGRASEVLEVNNIDTTVPLITFSTNPKDLTEVSVNVMDDQSGFKQLFTPVGDTITELPYEFDATERHGTFIAEDNAGNKSSKEYVLSPVSIGGSESHTFVGIEGIPSEWTNEGIQVRVGAQNETDGVESINLVKKNNFVMFRSLLSGVGNVKTAKAGDAEDKTKTKVVNIENNGIYEYTVTNKFGTHTEDVVIDKIDKVAPTVKAEVFGGVVSYSAGDDMSGIKYIYLPNGEVVEFEEDEKLGHTGVFEMSAEGEFTIVVEDFAGNRTEEVFSMEYVEPEEPVEEEPVEPETPEEPTEPETPEEPVEEEPEEPTEEEPTEEEPEEPTEEEPTEEEPVEEEPEEPETPEEPVEEEPEEPTEEEPTEEEPTEEEPVEEEPEEPETPEEPVEEEPEEPTEEEPTEEEPTEEEPVEEEPEEPTEEEPTEEEPVEEEPVEEEPTEEYPTEEEPVEEEPEEPTEPEEDETDKEGYDEDGYDKDGFDKDGFDKEGIDKDGYDKDGFDKDGFDKEGIDKDGYDKDGFDSEGYDREGLDKEGLDKSYFNKGNTEDNKGNRENNEETKEETTSERFQQTGATIVWGSILTGFTMMLVGLGLKKKEE